MFCDRNSCRRNDDGSGGRDVPGADAVAARAHDIDGIRRRDDAERALAHDGGAGSDFLDSLTAHAKPHQEGCNLRRRRLAGHDGLEGGACGGGIERLALGEPRDDGLEVGHCPRSSPQASSRVFMPASCRKLRRMSCPCSEAMLSG